MLVGHAAGGAGGQQLQVVACNRAADAAASRVDGYLRGAVIDAVHGADAGQGHRRARDVDGDACGAGDGVVGRVGAAQVQAAQHHRLVLPGVLVQHHRAARAGAWDVDGDDVAGDHVTVGAAHAAAGAGAADADLHRRRAVIDAVGGGDAAQARHVQWPWRDAAAGAGRAADQCVVAGVGA